MTSRAIREPNRVANNVGGTPSKTAGGGESDAAAANAQGACERSCIGAWAGALDMPGISAIASTGGIGDCCASIEQSMSGEALAFGIQPSGSSPRSSIPAIVSVTAKARSVLSLRKRERTISS
jgi:hypothetical protein